MQRKCLQYENEIGNHRKVDIWEKVGENTVREINHELSYNYPNEQWELTHEFIRTYEITENGVLVGDGSNWSGDGRHWLDHATKRFEKGLSLRFPYEQGEKEPTPDAKDIAKNLIEANY